MPERLLAVASEPGASGHVDTIRALFSARGLRLPPITFVDSLQSLLAVIASAQGLSIIPSLIGREHGTRILTKPLNVAGEVALFSLWGAWRRDETSLLVRNFVGVLRAQTSAVKTRGRVR